MHELYSKADFEQIIGLVLILGTILCGMTAIIGCAWHKTRCAEYAAVLKQDMLERGMGADEIQAVLAAGKKPSLKALHRNPRPDSS